MRFDQKQHTKGLYQKQHFTGDMMMLLSLEQKQDDTKTR